MKKAGLNAPAGDMDKLKLALNTGADSVLVGGEKYNLKTGSHNFSKDELVEAVEYTHSLEKELWVTLDIIPTNLELEGLDEYVKYLESIKVDGVMVSDLGVFQVVKDNSSLKISVSTQSSNTNWRAVKMWYELGARRVVLAREISIDNIAEIRAKVPEMEVEVHIHGAMCMSTSGRSLLSNYMATKDITPGDNEFWRFSVEEQTRPGEFMPVYEDEHGTHIFHSRDLCTIEYLDRILDLEVDSLNIEGRMMSSEYLVTSVRVYREAMDRYYSGNYKYDEEWLKELQEVSPRGYTAGFYFVKPGEKTRDY